MGSWIFLFNSIWQSLIVITDNLLTELFRQLTPNIFIYLSLYLSYCYLFLNLSFFFLILFKFSVFSWTTFQDSTLFSLLTTSFNSLLYYWISKLSATIFSKFYFFFFLFSPSGVHPPTAGLQSVSYWQASLST